MLDRCDKVQRLERSPSTNQPARPPTFIFAGLNAFKPRKTLLLEDSSRVRSRCGSSTSSTRRVSTGSLISYSGGDAVATDRCIVEFDSDGDENDVDLTVAPAGDRPSRRWRRLQLRPQAKTAEAKPATVMYSIAFYPWKMEAHGYYSHPEAAANWVPDTASARCQICTTAFSLIRRRHHCRLCGHLVCANCSHDRTYLPFAGDSRSQHRLIKDGAPQRTCSACASTLRNMAAQDDPRVKRFTIAVSSNRKRKSTASSNLTSSQVEVDIERPSPWLRRSGMAITDADIEDEEFYMESTRALEHDPTPSETTHHYPLRLSVTRAEELDEILCARARSRLYSSQPTTNQCGDGVPSGSRQFVISSVWLDQWLQYVRVDPVSEHAASSGSSTQQLSDDGGRRLTTRWRMPRPPRPGPVANYELLEFVNGELVPKSGLQRCRGSHSIGDYRVVSQDVWVTFLGLYGGGPSIQVPLNNDVECLSKMTSTGSLTKLRRDCPQWIISELDDSLPAIAAAPPVDLYSPATRKAAARASGTRPGRVNESKQKSSSHKMHKRRLISAASMSSLANKPSQPNSRRRSVFELIRPRKSRPTTSTELTLRDSHSQWKLENEHVTQVTVIDQDDDLMSSSTFSTSGRRRTVGDASTLAAVSAFASAATLARQRSAMSLSRYPPRSSSRSNDSILENE